MSIKDIENKFALRRYLISEIDALRQHVFHKAMTGRYFPTMDDWERVPRRATVDESVIEERVRTLMIAGITADDLFDNHDEGFVLTKFSMDDIAKPFEDVEKSWWSHAAQGWVDALARNCIQTTQLGAVEVMAQRMVHHTWIGKDLIPAQKIHSLNITGMTHHDGVVYLVKSARIEKDGTIIVS